LPDRDRMPELGYDERPVEVEAGGGRLPGGSPWWRRLVPLALVVLGVCFVWWARDLGVGGLTKPGPGLWPLLIASFLSVTGVFLFVADDPKDYEPWTSGSSTVLAAVVSLIGFVLLFLYAGFLLASMTMLGVWLRLFAREPWRWAIPLALSGGLMFFLIFDVVLGVPFPPGLLDSVMS
jgi:putative tricarboxylic transport membrane protein